MSNRRTPTKTVRKKHPRPYVLFIYGALICFGVVLLIVGQRSVGQRTAGTSRDADRRPAEEPIAKAPPRDRMVPSHAELGGDSPDVVEDDGRTPWVSPTTGPPLNLRYLSPGVQIILAMRPRTFLRHPEAQKVLQGLGPSGARAVASLEELTRVSPAEMEQLVLGWQSTGADNWRVSAVVLVSQPKAIESIVHLDGAQRLEHEGQAYLQLADHAYYSPEAENGKVLVVAPKSGIADIIAIAGEPPPLRRDVERLLAHTDAQRDVTLMFTPNSLFSEGGRMFADEMAALRKPLFWFLGDELSAAALSLHWDEDFFVELIAIPTLDTSPERAARILAERVAVIPDRLESYVVGLHPQPYGRMMIARLPAMVRKLSAYTRSGFDAEHVVLNAYLPAVAGHNLLMGAELTLAESAGGTRLVAEATSPSMGDGGTEKSPEEKLRQPTTLRFARDTLDAALRQLSQDIGVEIIIRGSDLQADGITKNQSFGVDIADKPAEEVLVEILRLANPDKTAIGPNDVKQKLVYVIDKSGDGGQQIVVTTRTAAAARGEELPAAFQVATP